MSLEDALKSVKLKKSKEKIKDYSSPKLAGFMSEQDIEVYQNEVLDVNAESWIDILKTVTFPTKFCPMSIEQARLFIKIYEENFKDKPQETLQHIKWKSTLNDADVLSLKRLTLDLNATMDEYLKHDGFVFVKTSSRSAKDAPLYQANFLDLYKKEINKISGTISENVKMTCLLLAAFQALKIKSAEQAIETFVTSERIYQDMLLAVKCDDRFHENFMVRKFVEIDVDMEFRGFVFNYELTALSQYNYLIYSERLNQKKDEIQRIVCNFYNNAVKPLLRESKYKSQFIIDFAVCLLGSGNAADLKSTLWVIEINPFMETTDGALFSWQHEKDILEGQRGFQFRITDRERPGAKTMLPIYMRQIISELI